MKSWSPAGGDKLRRSLLVDEVAWAIEDLNMCSKKSIVEYEVAGVGE